ncbi:tRNA modification GTPase MnmE [Tepiditoga spiralis]|uniref:tRNA modification GTPase MnmE n=1 Tax=Tepiditoga spiralis TaxID=2108365 RepID=A0A7G1G5C3_9BACT|nr:tRNA uridine-5-carboxymethylaminomethyl(34) synthesis GTPase MnmE [Tepiditoga spiralis]BBE31315.1 tRNA modification GTPase MnmE [Tepiditoga spiralis]
MIYDTIAAISTPNGTGALSIIRVSGKDIIKIIDKILKKKNFESKKMYYGWIYDNDEKVDEVTWVYHKSPNSYTGEEMLEIFGHGGKLITYKVYKTILKNGARPAVEGEFSKRAVLNGKMDLIKAESINDVIHANTEYALKASFKQLSENLSKKINNIKEKLLNVAARIEVEMDYPDDFEEDNYDLEKKLISIKEDSEKILKNSDNGIIAVQGLKVTIVGKPNSGKSTLLNALLKKDRAIVTDIPGTTRDTIEESLNIKGIYLKIIDTAGIRETKDIVEKIGVEKSKKSIDESDLILFVVDGTNKISKEDKEIYEYIQKKNKKRIILINKKDDVNFKEDLLNKFNKEIVLKISAKNQNVSELEDKIYEMYYKDLDIKDPTLITERQKYTFEEALENINSAIKGISQEIPNDIIMYDIKNSIKKIMELTGEDYTEELLNKMFSNFCVGK